MNKKDYLETWGYLEAFKNELILKAEDARNRAVKADYERMVSDILLLQQKITAEADKLAE